MIAFHSGLYRWPFVAALVLWMAGCGSGVEGPSPYELWPPLEEPQVRSTIVVGSLNDHWLETMQYVGLGRASHDGQHGYAVTFDVPGGEAGRDVFVLFWPREQIEFTDATRPVTFGELMLGSERVFYPNIITAESLPRVHRGIVILEKSYAREADGAITAMEGFVVVVSLGGGPRLIKTPRGPPPVRPAVPAARVAASKFKPLTERNFRENLIRLTGGQPKGAHAHHVLPKKFARECQQAGINVHDPRYGAWWPASQHLSAAKAYNAEWQFLFRPGQTPSTDQILQYGRKLAAKYGLQIYF